MILAPWAKVKDGPPQPTITNHCHPRVVNSCGSGGGKHTMCGWLLCRLQVTLRVHIHKYMLPSSCTDAAWYAKWTDIEDIWHHLVIEMYGT